MIPLHERGRHPAHADISSFGLSCLLSRRCALDAAELRRFTAELMAAISRACYSLGAVDVGHIKSYTEYEGGFLMADTVGDPSEVNVDGKDGDPVDHFRVVINAVVCGLDKAGIKEAAKESLGVIARAFGLSLDIAEEDESGL
jgi:hypothetical protein